MALNLPNAVVGRPDVNRILRELVSLNDFFVAASSRPAGSALAPPQLSKNLELLAQNNGYNLLEETHRQQLAAALQDLTKQAPQLHISFVTDPSPKVLERILLWLRTNIHPQSLLQVGIQPNIVAGCVVRTPNRWLDMSLRKRMQQEEKYLIELINGAERE